MLRAICTGLAHILAATLGVAILSTLLFYTFKPILGLLISSDTLSHDVVLVLPFFPFQCFIGLLAGFSVWMRLGSFGRVPAARFAWVIPTALFILLFASWGTHSVLGETRWEHYFWSNNGFSKKDQLITTLPFLTSVTYSIGNSLGLLYQHGQS